MAENRVKGSTRRVAQAVARTFFEISPDWRFHRLPGFTIENEADLLFGRPILGPGPGEVGFPDYPESPRLLIDPKLGRPPNDFEQYSVYWLVSDRMKDVLETVDSEGCVFVSCDVRHAKEKPTQGYWLCDFVRRLDAVDENASHIGIIRDAHAEGGRYYSFSGGARVVFKLNVVGSAHIFGLAYARACFFCDQELKQACNAAEIKGIQFTDVANM
jgi:hypothetical protein